MNRNLIAKVPVLFKKCSKEKVFLHLIYNYIHIYIIKFVNLFNFA